MINNSRPTNVQTFHSSLHGRERREQRGISKTQLQQSNKYGLKQEGKMVRGDQRYLYTYRGVTYVTDSNSTQEITSYESPDNCGASSAKLSDPEIC